MNSFSKVNKFFSDLTQKPAKYNILIHIFFILFGLLSFSYFIQANDCFNFLDPRRNIIFFISGFVIIGTILYSLPYYIKSENQDDPNTDDYKYEIIKTVLLFLTQIILLLLVFFPIMVLCSSDLKSETPITFEIFKRWASISSVVLIFGGTIPFSETVMKSLVYEPVRTSSEFIY